MEVITIQKNIRTSPRKLRLVADMIRSKKPAHALQTLQFTKKSAAQPLAKAIGSVLANARQLGLEEEKLSFSKIEINEGTALKRFRAGSRGRVNPYKKRMSHIKIVLTEGSTQDSKLKTQEEKNLISSKKEVSKKYGTKNSSSRI